MVPDSTATEFVTRSFNERRSSDIITNAATSDLGINQPSTYASSTENISRLLEGWMRSSPKTPTHLKGPQEKMLLENDDRDSSLGHSTAMANLQYSQPKSEKEGGDLVGHEEFDSILSFENLNNAAWDNSTCDSMPKKCSQTAVNDDQKVNVTPERNKPRSDNAPPLSFIEKWLLDETAAQVEEMMELSPMF